MYIYEIKDVIRDLLPGGRDSIAPHMISYIMGLARREIEKSHNFYWMRNVKTHSLTASQRGYSIYTSSNTGIDSGLGTGLNLPNWKDSRVMLERGSSETQWNEIPLMDFNEVEREYGTADTGEPELAIVDNATLWFWPIPDAAYVIKWYYFNWTSNPTDSTTSSTELGTDDLTARWPEAMIYAGVMVGYRLLMKDEASADHYRKLLEQEIKRIRVYDIDRAQAQRVELTPHTGPNSRVQRRVSDYDWI